MEIIKHEGKSYRPRADREEITAADAFQSKQSAGTSRDITIGGAAMSGLSVSASNTYNYYAPVETAVFGDKEYYRLEVGADFLPTDSYGEVGGLLTRYDKYGTYPSPTRKVLPLGHTAGCHTHPTWRLIGEAPKPSEPVGGIYHDGDLYLPLTLGMVIEAGDRFEYKHGQGILDNETSHSLSDGKIQKATTEDFPIQYFRKAPAISKSSEVADPRDGTCGNPDCLVCFPYNFDADKVEAATIGEFICPECEAVEAMEADDDLAFLEDAAIAAMAAIISKTRQLHDKVSAFDYDETGPFAEVARGAWAYAEALLAERGNH